MARLFRILTDYLSGKRKIEVPPARRKWKDSITVVGARENNLKNLKVTFPLRHYCGDRSSGSGKFYLIKKILYPATGRANGSVAETPGKYDQLTEGCSQNQSCRVLWIKIRSANRRDPIRSAM